ncbi:MAG: cyclopropane-fatty-acyl-phospholipid synthase family protein [Gammaproteobacteria bacterium]
MNDSQEMTDETTGHSLAGPDRVLTARSVTGAGSVTIRLARHATHNLLRTLSTGRLRITDALGTWHFGPPAMPEVTLRIHDQSAYVDIASGGSIGAAEAYMAGKWSTTDLPGVMRLMARNRDLLIRMETGMSRAGSALLKLTHCYQRNTRTGSRRNIRAHYDLGDPLFALFLDPTMMYSSAVFPRDDSTLEQASLHKLDLVCQKLALSPDDHLLEIGTGWGGLAVHAASRFGCRVTTTTISRNQFDYASRRVREAGLADRITVLGTDYRDLTGSFDKLVSIEMIEAVGHRFLDTYFRICSERLKPAGRMLLQSIVIADRNFEYARRSVDFIQKYIFPGGALPSVGTALQSIGRVTDLQLTSLQDIGMDYARTLQIWRERFLNRVHEVRNLGYPDEFVRMWEWYLAYCEGGFRERVISAAQLVFDKPGCRLEPWRASA